MYLLNCNHFCPVICHKYLPPFLRNGVTPWCASRVWTPCWTCGMFPVFHLYGLVVIIIQSPLCQVDVILWSSFYIWDWGTEKFKKTLPKVTALEWLSHNLQPLSSWEFPLASVFSFAPEQLSPPHTPPIIFFHRSPPCENLSGQVTHFLLWHLFNFSNVHLLGSLRGMKAGNTGWIMCNSIFHISWSMWMSRGTSKGLTSWPDTTTIQPNPLAWPDGGRKPP